MTQALTLVAALLAAAAGAAAQTAPSSPASADAGGVRFDGNRAFRAFDCHGGDAVISGNGNQLKMTDCARLTLSGAKNRVDVTLSSPGDITVGGSKNVVRYRSPDDGAPRVTDNGADDDIRPVAN